MSEELTPEVIAELERLLAKAYADDAGQFPWKTQAAEDDYHLGDARGDWVATFDWTDAQDLAIAAVNALPALLRALSTPKPQVQEGEDASTFTPDRAGIPAGKEVAERLRNVSTYLRDLEGHLQDLNELPASVQSPARIADYVDANIAALSAAPSPSGPLAGGAE